MSDLLETLKARYSEQLQGLGLLSVEVPELGKIWFRPQKAMNATEYNTFVTAAQRADFESMVDILILRARHEDGRKLFRPADKKDMMVKVSADDIQDMVNQMFTADGDGEVDVKK